MVGPLLVGSDGMIKSAGFSLDVRRNPAADIHRAFRDARFVFCFLFFGFCFLFFCFFFCFFFFVFFFIFYFFLILFKGRCGLIERLI